MLELRNPGMSWPAQLQEYLQQNYLDLVYLDGAAAAAADSLVCSWGHPLHPSHSQTRRAGEEGLLLQDKYYYI